MVLRLADVFVSRGNGVGWETGTGSPFLTQFNTRSYRKWRPVCAVLPTVLVPGNLMFSAKHIGYNW